MTVVYAYTDGMTYESALEQAISDQILTIANRKDPKVNQTELAEAAGITRESMNKYLRGRVAMPLPVLIAVCDHLEVPLRRLVALAEAQTRQQ